MQPSEIDTKIRATLAHKADIETRVSKHYAEIAELHDDAAACDAVVDALLDVRALT